MYQRLDDNNSLSYRRTSLILDANDITFDDDFMNDLQSEGF